MKKYNKHRLPEKLFAPSWLQFFCNSKLKVSALTKVFWFTILATVVKSSVCEEIKAELIPNSDLKVSFPSGWNFSKPYVGNGKYSSINLNLPKEEHGGYPAYPEFEFEFLGSGSQDERLEYLLKTDLASKKIDGIASKVFSYKSKVSYLHGDMSHSYGRLQVTGYLVPIDKGHLICALTTDSDESSEHNKYIKILKTYCTGAVKSAKSPNKTSQSEA